MIRSSRWVAACRRSSSSSVSVIQTLYSSSFAVASSLMHTCQKNLALSATGNLVIEPKIRHIARFVSDFYDKSALEDNLSHACVRKSTTSLSFENLNFSFRVNESVKMPVMATSTTSITSQWRTNEGWKVVILSAFHIFLPRRGRLFRRLNKGL